MWIEEAVTRPFPGIHSSDTYVPARQSYRLKKKTPFRAHAGYLARRVLVFGSTIYLFLFSEVFLGRFALCRFGFLGGGWEKGIAR